MSTRRACLLISKVFFFLLRIFFFFRFAFYFNGAIRDLLTYMPQFTVLTYIHKKEEKEEQIHFAAVFTLTVVKG